MPPFRILALVVSTSLVAGCAVGPDYQRADAPLADRYLGQAAIEQRPAATPASFAQWWEGFGDPLLSSLVAKALEQNLDMAQARARVSQARAGLGAANAALLPSGSVNGQAARAYQSVETPLGQVLDSTPGYDRYGNSYEANLEASWELDVFGGLRRGREAAVAEYQASEAGVVATRLAIAAQTADVYTVIRGLQVRLEIAERQVKTQEDLLDKVRLLHSRGLAAEYQVDQTEGELSQVRASVPVLRAGLDAAMNALDVVLGAPPGTHRDELAAARAIPRAPQISETGSPADLLRRRPDLIAAERRLEAANARIGVAISEYYPKFSLGALIGSATTSGGNLFSSGASQSAGVLGLRWRLFDFGRINAQIDQAKGQEAEALASYRLSVLRATEDVENAFSALINRESQASTLVAGETSLTRARQSSFIAYQNGTASLIDVLNADETLLQASDARAQAQTESARAAIAAFRALGGGWQPHAHPEVAASGVGE
ncbi:NodT family efflux transporter outer membrane factor (OMF) lipoprotein [Pseudomonas sp. BIGb0408]|uniref:NodT family efflux transporter outer membrane factor (OMF) lipoprotein n=1 Tax=Phytopseudomonas flavescens TaxID=29435 RepID=A0A7Y9XI02_9GAMM|nr:MULTISPECIES: TolC family protein [Pseudomonas]MCW2293777.1 NodT family efflux transporter outer membrane factor (OMF) lipoprotein [Pseudomonas sp. BIGb0408]NYH71653.1 NodT family efflux transporter outer membrane factor (OMF) lipoprotein [Pseudomonas flavescens]